MRSAPITLVDVGASGGLPRRWEAAQEHLRVVGFEPDERSFRALKPDARRIWIQTALHQEKGVVDLHFTRKPMLSSFLPPNRRLLERFPEVDRFDVVATSKVEVDTLDRMLVEHGVDDPDFLKLDTQGSELWILKGAARALRSAVGVEVEVEFTEIYQDQPLFPDVDGCLRDAGFALYDLKPYRWKRIEGRDAGGLKGQLVFADALYLREPEAFREVLKGYGSPERRVAKVMHAIEVARLYGFADHAFAVLAASADLLVAEDAAWMTDLVHGWSRGSRVPRALRRGRIATLLRRAADAFETTENGWSAGSELGNRR